MTDLENTLGLKHHLTCQNMRLETLFNFVALLIAIQD